MKTFLSLMLIAGYGLSGTTAVGQNALPGYSGQSYPGLHCEWK